jgi:glycosyltransferase involved in cell wall biosynthesis
MANIGIDLQMISRPQLTGMGRYISELLPRFRDYKDFNWVELRPKPIRFYRTIWEHTVLPLSLIAKGVNLLFCPANIAPIWIPWGVKTILTVHDVRVKVFPETFSKGTRAYYEFLYSATLHRVDRIITVSEFSKNEIIKYFPETKNKITVIYEAIDTNKFKFLNLPREKQILMLGAIAKHKNVLNILKAFSLAVNEIPHKLIIVGSKDSGLPIEEEVNEVLEKIPSDRVIFTGKLSDEEIIELYNKSEFFVFPSLYEGFGFPPLEAMACGCPVIVSYISSLPETVGDAGLFVDPYKLEDIANKMVLMASNQELRDELREKGFERVKNFSWSKAAKEHVDVFKEVLNEV